MPNETRIKKNYVKKKKRNKMQHSLYEISKSQIFQFKRSLFSFKHSLNLMVMNNTLTKTSKHLLNFIININQFLRIRQSLICFNQEIILLNLI